MDEYFIKSVEQLTTLLNFPKLLRGTGCEFEMDYPFVNARNKLFYKFQNTMKP